jgi:hypothetical protein
MAAAARLPLPSLAAPRGVAVRRYSCCSRTVACRDTDG